MRGLRNNAELLVLLISIISLMIGIPEFLRVPATHAAISPSLIVGDIAVKACSVVNQGWANAEDMRMRIQVQPKGPYELTIYGAEGMAELHTSSGSQIISEGEVLTIPGEDTVVALDRLVSGQTFTTTVKSDKSAIIGCVVASNRGVIGPASNLRMLA